MQLRARVLCARKPSALKAGSRPKRPRATSLQANPYGSSPSPPPRPSGQVAMEPLARDDAPPGSRGAEFAGAAGWPAQPKLVPVVIVCKGRQHRAGAVRPRWLATSCLPAAGAMLYSRAAYATHAPGTLSRSAFANGCMPGCRLQGATAATTWRSRAPLTTGRRASRCSTPGRTGP